MHRFEPFPGLRFSRSHIPSLDDVVCPPYDVITPGRRATLKARHPANIVRLEVPDAEDAEDADGADDPYKAAAVLLDSWRDGGVLQRDPAPAFYGYRMTWIEPGGTERCTVGVIGALRLDSPDEVEEAAVLPHERTMPKARSDRLALLQATRANLSPIWCLSPAKGLTDLVPAPAHPVECAFDADGVCHQLWPIADPGTVAAVAEAVGSTAVLIADGHHRYETAVRFREMERAAGRGHEGDHELVMALVVELCDSQLAVQATHRLLSGLPHGFDLLEALAPWLELTPTDPPDAHIEARMAEAAGVAVLTPEGSWIGRARPQLLERDPYELDSSRIDVVLGELPPHEVRYQHGWADCAAAVSAGTAQAAILLRPATVAQIQSVAHGGERMPPKTTYFWPKPLTGMVVRELID